MERFNVRCPDHYPMKCNLSPADEDYLLSSEKYKAFFIFQYNNQDEWLSSTIERYFSERTWRLFNAGKEGGTGTKFCNICRYALASDFGIVSLTPLNYNVFQEIGLMQGLQKQLLYILNPDRLNDKNKLPFDMDDQIYIKHRNKEDLETGLDKKMSLILDKVQLLSGFEREKKIYIRDKLKQLSEKARTMLKIILLEGSAEYSESATFNGLETFISRSLHLPVESSKDIFRELMTHRFILSGVKSAGERAVKYNRLNEYYIKDLEKLLWEK